MSTNSSAAPKASRLALLAGELRNRQAALDRFSRDGCGGFQARQIAESMRDMVKAVNVTVTFKRGRHALERTYMKELIRLADALKNLPAIRVCIDAHSDLRGPRRLNRQLAFDRARMVRGVFLSRGVPVRRITARALIVAHTHRPSDARRPRFAERQAIIRFDLMEDNP